MSILNVAISWNERDACWSVRAKSGSAAGKTILSLSQAILDNPVFKPATKTRKARVEGDLTDWKGAAKGIRRGGYAWTGGSTRKARHICLNGEIVKRRYGFFSEILNRKKTALRGVTVRDEMPVKRATRAYFGERLIFALDPTDKA